MIEQNTWIKKQRYKMQRRPSYKGPYADNAFVLTLHTDNAHHKRMTSLRKDYSPSAFLMRVPHLTLFHGRPASKMEDVIVPTIQDVASRTSAFSIYAAPPIRLENGVGVGIAPDSGGVKAHRIYDELLEIWRAQGILSKDNLDPGEIRYTVVDRVTEEDAIDRAFQGVQNDFQGDRGTVNGLSLWRCQNDGWLAFQRKFDFRAGL